MLEKTVLDLVRGMEKNDQNGQTTYSAYVTQNMREDINKTEAYLNSKFISGEKDYMGRDKPFFNIVIAGRNIWYRATDIDCKNLVFRAKTKLQVIPAFLATLKLQEWINKVNLGQFLNDWGLSLASHGSSIVKFVEKEKELFSSVEDWNDILVDPVDFDNNIKIKKLWFTPAQLKKQKGYNKNFVQQLLDSPVSRETMDGTKKDNKADYILVYEVHGELPLSLLSDKEKDDDTYVQQMHIVSFQQSKEGGFNDYTLFRGPEKRDPFMITHLLKKDGQTYSGGAVKNLFQAQWMVNHSQKQIKDHLDLASKIFFQTSDGSFAGKNATDNLETGEFFVTKPNEPVTRLNNQPDIAAMQSNKADWQNNANQINGVAESMVSQAKSGTAWRQTQAELQEAHSLFELMIETKGLYLKEMFKKFIIPYFKKQLKNADEINNILEANQIKWIDARYIPSETIKRVNQKKKEVILSGEIYDPAQEEMDMAEAGQEVQSELQGNQRFIKPSKVNWEKEFEDLDWDNLEIDVTGENYDTQALMATYDTAFKFLISLQGRAMTEDEKLVFNKMMSATNAISPLELSFNQTTRQSVPQPAIAGAGVGGSVPMGQSI